MPARAIENSNLQKLTPKSKSHRMTELLQMLQQFKGQILYWLPRFGRPCANVECLGQKICALCKPNAGGSFSYGEHMKLYYFEINKYIYINK